MALKIRFLKFLMAPSIISLRDSDALFNLLKLQDGEIEAFIHQLPEGSMEAEAFKRVKAGELALPDPILKPSYKMKFEWLSKQQGLGKKTGRYVKNDSCQCAIYIDAQDLMYMVLQIKSQIT